MDAPKARAVPLGELVRRGRSRIGATQEDLARRSGVSVRTISNLESGRIAAPRLSSVRAIAAALGLDDAATTELCALVAANDPPRDEPVPIREPLTRLLGRDRELAALVGRLTDRSARLVTVTGMAGIGKTRLAQAVARTVQRRGVPTWWVPLAALARADLAVSAVADAVDAPKSTIESIDGRLPEPAVLVIDNVEHLPGIDAVIADLLDRLAGVTILATGRAPLRVAGEQEWPLSPLPVPHDVTPEAVRHTPAAALLIERIRSTMPGFELTIDNAPTVAEVCRLLDGLPLALELAAAQWRVRGGADVLRAIRHDPLDLRDVGARAPDHMSLRVALAATCELLTEDQRRTLRCLSAFHGGWTLDAATAVADRTAVIDDLDRLMALGLVRSADSATGRRFSMLPTITAFAADEARGQLSVTAARRQAEWLRHWVLTLDLSTGGVSSAAPFLHAERDNLRAALSWFDSHDPESGLKVTSALYHYWRHDYAAEGLAWYLAFVDRSPDAGARATGLWRAAWLARNLAQLADAEDLASRALQASDACVDPRLRVKALTVLANIIELRRPGLGLTRHREAVDLAERIGDPELSCNTLSQLAAALGDLGKHDEAVRMLRRGVAVATQHGRSYDRLGALLNIAHNLNVRGDHAEADAALAEGEPLLDAVGPPDARTYWQAQRAIARVGLGDLDEASELARLALADATGDQEHQYTNEAWIASAEVALAAGRRADAADAFRAVLSSRFRLASPVGRCLVLAGLALASAEPRTAAASIAAIDALRSEYGFELATPTRRRVESVHDRWRTALGARWPDLMADAGRHQVDDLLATLTSPH